MIRRFDALADNDLMLVEHRGLAYQRDMTKGRKAYDAAYLANYDRYAAGPIAEKLNAGRVEFLARFVDRGARVLDVGAASGIFVRAARAHGFKSHGFDVIPEAVARLRDEGRFADDAKGFDAVTFWDSIEHMDEPEQWLAKVPRLSIVVAAIPVFEDLGRIRQSKHYKPGEHLYYFTARGFIEWMALYGFRLLDVSAHETDAGRERIGAFAFIRDLPDFNDYVEAYTEMHSNRFYGGSATELYLDTVADVVRTLKPGSILDYGCGRSDLVAHFWNDGERRIARYDPAIRPYRRLPDKGFDLVFCCDVMEHIPMASVDRVLGEIRRKAERALFTISTKLARARLPDGSNAHCTLLSKREWMRWIKSYFANIKVLREDTEHELVLLATE